MAFKSGIVVTTPDAAPKKHRASIKTPNYELTAVVEQGKLDQTVEVYQELTRNKGGIFTSSASKSVTSEIPQTLSPQKSTVLDTASAVVIPYAQSKNRAMIN